FIESAISARDRSGVIAMFDGGPITVLETSSMCWTLGGKVEKSRIEMESGSVAGMTRMPPVVRSTLFSLPESTSCARKAKAGAAVKTTKHTKDTERRRPRQTNRRVESFIGIIGMLSQ